jgi:hypothetical protein
VSSAPDYCEPIVGWRTWRAVQRQGEVHLMSLFHRVCWPALEPLAGTCRSRQWTWLRKRTSHASPDASCQCGIYASTLEVAATYVAEPDPSRWHVATEQTVIGEVALWGDVVECTNGWRASFAYPRRLFVPADARSWDSACLTRQLGRYGVPVEVIEATRCDDVVRALASVQQAA